jgi:hypothetical protein
MRSFDSGQSSGAQIRSILSPAALCFALNGPMERSVAIESSMFSVLRIPSSTCSECRKRGRMFSCFPP